MKKFITCLLLGTLLGMIPPPLPAQQNQNQEMEALKKRVSELEKQLQTVENIEKLDLQAKLADANAKLANTDFGKFKTELRVDNDDRMRACSYWFFSILGIIVVISGGAIWFLLKSLIADRVEKNLNGFKAAVEEQNVIKNQLGALEKAHAVSVLKGMFQPAFKPDHPSPEEIKALSEEVLLQVFRDEIYQMKIRLQAVYVSFDRKSHQLVSPFLEFLNSVIDLDSSIVFSMSDDLHTCMNLLRTIHTPDTYQGLTEFLNRLLTANTKQKNYFLVNTISLLADVSVELNMKDSVSILRKAIPHLKDLHQQPEGLKRLVEHFDKFNEPEGIKEILTDHLTSEMFYLGEVEEKCLELLQKHNPEFVTEWRASETTENST